MIKKLPFILFLILATSIVAQTTSTVSIDWGRNSTPSSTGNANSSRTIEVGDTVAWTWYSSGSHNVKSTAASNETFESDFFQNGGTYSRTFTSVGTNEYICSPHPSDMFGTITVVAEGVLGITDAKRLLFDMFPNPASDNITIQLPSGTENATVQFYDYLGRLALSKKVTRTKDEVAVSSLSKGVYVLKVVTEDKIGSQKFVKN
jgi:plastocyanin